MDKRYFDILDKITEEKIDITKLYILSCMGFSSDEKNWEVMQYTYECWLEADTDLDIARLACIASDNWEEIENGEIERQEIIDECLI